MGDAGVERHKGRAVGGCASPMKIGSYKGAPPQAGTLLSGPGRRYRGDSRLLQCRDGDAKCVGGGGPTRKPPPPTA